MLNKNEKLSVIVPVYNEAGGVINTIDSLKTVLDKFGCSYEIIVVNDASTDKTVDLLKQIERIKTLNNPYNLGYGASLKKGIKESNADWILIIDADGTYPIDYIPKLLEPAGDYDMVVGNRQHEKDHFGRKPAKWILKKLASFLAGYHIPDLNSGMRIFRRSIALEFFHLFPSGFSFTSTITIACFSNDYTVKYIDIPYYKRIGQSSIRPFHFFKFAALILKLFFYFKPLKMITPLALAFVFFGLAKMIRDILVVHYIGTLASLLITFGVLLFFISLISEIIVKRISR